MNKNGIHDDLIKRFPLLSLAGGYELLLYQRGIDQGFHKIPIPHTPPRIKELAEQANIYIRPLQQNIQQLHVQIPNDSYDQSAQEIQVSNELDNHVDKIIGLQYNWSCGVFNEYNIYLEQIFYMFQKLILIFM